jgi:multiple sugar transport system substrate-binding protein
VAPLPHWTAGAQVSSKLGASTSAVTTQGAHPEEAAAFDLWLHTDPVASKMVVATTQLVPQRRARLNDPSLLNAADPFFGGQRIFRLFVQSLKQAGPIQRGAEQDYVREQLTNNIGAVADGTMSVDSCAGRQVRPRSTGRSISYPL